MQNTIQISDIQASGQTTYRDQKTGLLYTTRWEIITPAIAAEYLSLNTRNRNKSKSVAAGYAIDMTHNNWLVTHQGIAFDSENRLSDGQHRLQGIIDSGVSVAMLVTRGLHPNTILTMDRMFIRNLANNLRIMGHSLGDSRSVGAARRMMAGPRFTHAGSSKETDTILKNFIDAHLEAILFSGKILTREYNTASIRSVLARAYYHAEPPILEQFASILCHGIQSGETLFPGARSAVTLREYVLKTREKRHGGTNYLASLYRKTQNALKAFIDGRDLKSLYENTDDLFPLPNISHGSEMEV